MASAEVDSSLRLLATTDNRHAHTLAKRYGLELVDLPDRPNTWHFQIERGSLALIDPDGASLILDEQSISRRMKGFGRGELARAVGLPTGKRILDALGGWGTDSVCLALFGHQLTYIEREPVIFTLARERIERMEIPIECHLCSAEEFMTKSDKLFDVVYLDAMFEPHKSGAKSSKVMQILAEFAQPCALEQLVQTARERAIHRVVLKRRRKDRSELPVADWSIQGKTIRYDVYRGFDR